MNTDTPRTDSETLRDEMDHVDTEFGPYAPSDTVSADFARQLERELAEATEESRLMRTSVIILSDQLSEAHEQRDTLVEVIRRALGSMSDSSYGDYNVGGAARVMLKEALAAIPPTT